jgi:hypothetical protein
MHALPTNVCYQESASESRVKYWQKECLEDLFDREVGDVPAPDVVEVLDQGAEGVAVSSDQHLHVCHACPSVSQLSHARYLLDAAKG